jgi:hypothetical protein
MMVLLLLLLMMMVLTLMCLLLLLCKPNVASLAPRRRKAVKLDTGPGRFNLLHRAKVKHPRVVLDSRCLGQQRSNAVTDSELFHRHDSVGQNAVSIVQLRVATLRLLHAEHALAVDPLHCFDDEPVGPTRVRTVRIGQQAARVDQQAARVGQQAAGVGQQVARVGQQVARVGQQAARVVQQVARAGQQAARVGQQARCTKMSTIHASTDDELV